MIKIYPLIAALFIVCMSIGYANAEESDENSSALLSEKQMLPVDDRVKALLTQSKNDLGDNQIIFNRLVAQSDAFNVAEQYLMLLIEANLMNHQHNYAKVIELLKQAITFEERMSYEQLYLPEFSQVHLMLSSAYAKTEQFQLAYDEKKLFMDKYRDYRKFLRENRMEKLNQKYETDIKFKQNELLASQQELKKLKLKEAEREQHIQQRNLIVLTVTAILFAALLIRQLRIRAILKHLAKTDSLTGLANRRTLFQSGEKLFEQAKTNNQPLSVMMMDIDHFKSINDEFGHDIGDKAIVAVGRLGKETLRAKDIFARIGGEEYAVVLPFTQLKEAKAIAERLREKVQQFGTEQLTNELENKQLTISIGVAEYNEDTVEFDELLHLADEAMYQAKQNGRNQVYC